MKEFIEAFTKLFINAYSFPKLKDKGKPACTIYYLNVDATGLRGDE